MNCMGTSADQPVAASGLLYEASNKHCEPITAEKPGTKCPKWAAPVAQRLLDLSVTMGEKRVATCRGIAFIAQKTHPEGNVWHGYPESWDKIDGAIKALWLEKKYVTRSDFRRWAKRSQVEKAWKELRDAD